MVVDLYHMLFDVQTVTLNGKHVYCQTEAGYFPSFWNALEVDRPASLEGLAYETIKLQDFDRQIILDGLKKFADWASNHYEKGKIIVYKPKFAKKYFSIKNELKPYEAEKLADIENRQQIWDEFTMELFEMIPGAKLLEDIDDSTALFGISDDIKKFPLPMHYSPLDYLKKAQKFLELVGIESNEPVTDMPSAEFELLKNRNLYILEVNRRKKLATRSLNLNSYFDKFEDIKNYLLVLTVKDDAQIKLKYFRRKALLGLKMGYGYRDSYVAIVDKSRNFVYEQFGPDEIEYDYEVGGQKIHASSAGYLAGSKTVVNISNRPGNLSRNRRGLNIVVFNSKTLEFIDSISCDLFGDDDLLVDSVFFNNLKIK